MKRLILLFLLIPALAFGYTYTIPYDDTPVSIVTNDGDNVVTVDKSVYHIMRGECWGAENCFLDLTAGTTVDIVLDAEGMTKGFAAFPTAWKTSNGYVTISLGTCTSYTGGELISVVNRNTDSTAVREATIHYNATITGGSFPTYDTILVGTAGTVQNAGGGAAVAQLPILLDNDTLYVFRIKIPTGSNIDVLDSGIIWFEVSEWD